MTAPNRRMIRFALTAAMVSASCGGASDAPSSSPLSEPTSTTADADTGAGSGDLPAATLGPIDGAIVSVLSTGLGLVAIDKSSGEHTALSAEGINFVERVDPMVTVGDTQYTVGFTLRTDQTFAHDVSIVAINRTDGRVDKVAELGFDRETDDSEFSITYTLVGANAEVAWVLQKNIVDGMLTESLREFVLASGAETAAWDAPTWELTTDSSECSAEPYAYRTGSSGRLYALIGGLPALVDVGTQSIEPVAGQCSDARPTFDDLVTDDDIATYTSTKSGTGLEGATAGDLYWATRPSASTSHWVIAGSSAWWIFGDGGTFDDERIFTSAVVEFDLTTRRIVNLFPLGDLAVNWNPDDDNFDLSPLNAELFVRDGALWILDLGDNGQLHRMDTATGTITSTLIDPQGADYTTASILDVDPTGIWLDVTRWTRKDERNTSGLGSLINIDSATGDVTLDIAESELVGS